MSQELRIKIINSLIRQLDYLLNLMVKNYMVTKEIHLASALLANNIHLVGRSFKYHRPRGIMTCGSEEPNAIVQIETIRHLQTQTLELLK